MMCVLNLLSALLLCTLGIHTGIAFTDPNICIAEFESDVSILKVPYCMATRQDINLACPKTKKIVISNLHVALKNSDESCTKRVLGSNNFFCCMIQKDDTLYDARCLQDVWNSEDILHYQEFTAKILQKCMGKSTCIVKSYTFANLQKEIPATRKYASYFQISYKCITDPTNTVDACSPNSVTGKKMHLQNAVSSSTKGNETCVCHLTSATMGNVVVRVVDVRVSSASLIFKSENREKDLSHSHEPLFGYNEIFTAQKLDVSLAKIEKGTDNKIWLHISGSNGQDVHVVCDGPQQSARLQIAETTTTMKSTIEPEVYEAPDVRQLEDLDEDEKLGEYWPIIYLAAGAGITFVVVVCILGSVLLCRCSLKKGKRDQGYSYPYHQSQVSYHKNGQYDTVLDDNMMTSQSEPYEWPHAFVK